MELKVTGLLVYVAFLLLLALLLPNISCIRDEGKQAEFSRIEFLPGFDGPLSIELYTGYVDVGKKEGVTEVNLFYYFIKSERDASRDPLLLWITGGPGCSAFSGLAFEIGPLTFQVAEYNGSLPKLIIKPYSWTKVANVIFLDAPVGTGFSYSNTKEGFFTGDLKSVQDNYEFLVKWLMKHPEFKANPLYIGGDSYSGMTVPALAKEIADRNEAQSQIILNLKGYLVGNPVTDSYFDAAVVPFAHGMGLISDELYDATRISCKENYASPRNEECRQKIDFVNQCIFGLYTNNILEPNCYLTSPNLISMRIPRTSRELHEVSKQRLAAPPFIPSVNCRDYAYVLSYYWANDWRVREALHIRKSSIREWQRCDFTLGLNYTVEISSALPYHKSLTSSGYRALVYSGDHDMVIPFQGTRNWIASFNYSVVDPWRSWWVDRQIAGFTRSYEHGITYATVKAAGHTAPEFKPKECLAMLERWLSYKPL